MRQSEGGTKLTQRNQPMRMYIATALIQLMETKKIEDITITELVKQANVSRMTFYKYFTSKEEVLSDYMYEIVNEYVEDIKVRQDVGEGQNIKRICHCLNFFKTYSPFILTLVKANMYSLIINEVNHYMEQYVAPTSTHSAYELYYYSGALCNVFVKWLESDMAEPPEKIAELVYNHWSVK